MVIDPFKVFTVVSWFQTSHCIPALPPAVPKSLQTEVCQAEKCQLSPTWRCMPRVECMDVGSATSKT